MPMLGTITAAAVPANAGVLLMARIRSIAGVLLTQGSVSSASYSVYDVDAGTTLVSSTALTVSSVVYNGLQYNATWRHDSPTSPGDDGAYGYNFAMTLPASAIPVASSGHKIQVDVVITPTSGQQLRIPFVLQTVKVYA